ncbi:MAG TPA: HAD family phosphatase [Bryobacteraceae bacterium]|nr:HAD family phosphatase [Bryobacteraceae bacterium]
MEAKAIIFDFGGVLCNHPPQKEIDELAALWGLQADEFLKHYWAHRLPYDRGDLTPEQYWMQFAESAGRSPADGKLPEVLRRDIHFWLHLQPRMIAWTRIVKDAGYRTALLSNLPRSLGEHLLAHCDFMRVFDHLALSYEVRSAKPEQRIYRYCLEGLGVAPEKAVFLDDRPANIRAAQALGIYGVLFETVEKFARGEGAHLNLPGLQLLYEATS